MDQCFVIQPFDGGGEFDKRYDQVCDPAIRSANLNPYRVDRDPSATIPIEKIEEGIRVSRVCIADITDDNPNVWFELGYAIAARREVVLICSSRRARFPFDVQHRNIIRYDTGSPSDFSTLQGKITERLVAICAKQIQLDALALASPAPAVQGLGTFEIATLVSVSQHCLSPGAGVAENVFREDMDRAGFSKIATMLGVRGLLSQKLLRIDQAHDYNGESYTIYCPTDAGVDWLLRNTARLKLTGEPRRDVLPDPIPF